MMKEEQGKHVRLSMIQLIIKIKKIIIQGMVEREPYKTLD